ncbi:MAG: helix-turn-helix transcriptional regulator [Clostridia bacterium]|nr:helix-turn-helix transcriptional regulator [Clostridia bacterium]
MTVSEINPNVRFASDAVLYIPSVWSRARDCRLIYLLQGQLLFECENKEYEISAGTLLIWQAGLRYRLTSDTAVNAIILNFDFTQNFSGHPYMHPVPDANFDPSSVLERVMISDCSILSELVVLPDMYFLEEDLRALVGEMNSQKSFFGECASAILKNVLIQAARTVSAGGIHTSGVVEQVISYIRQNFNRPITNHEIAAQVNYHEFYVSRLIQRQTGMTLHRYLIHVRVENAARLLATTTESVSHIAELCGFSSPAHFSSVFLHSMGETPVNYRNRRGLL